MASTTDIRDDAIFVEAGQMQQLQHLFDQANTEVEQEAARQAQGVQTRKERRAARKARGGPLAAASAVSSAAHNTAQPGKVEYAEAQVLAAPFDAARRIALAEAYLAVGRFSSAAASFSDAEELQALSPQTGLRHALSLMGLGKMQEAAQLLGRHQTAIPVADLGLAFALAGHTDRAIAVLSDAIRSGEGTVKIRQNLAYSYALGNRWRHARVMAAQDVPADEINDRIEEWSRTAHPDAWQARIAGLLNVSVDVYDGGMPRGLVLSNFTREPQLAGGELGDAFADTYSVIAMKQLELAVKGGAVHAPAPTAANAVEPMEVAAALLTAEQAAEVRDDAFVAGSDYKAPPVDAPVALAAHGMERPLSLSGLPIVQPVSAAVEVATLQRASVVLDANVTPPMTGFEAPLAAPDHGVLHDELRRDLVGQALYDVPRSAAVKPPLPSLLASTAPVPSARAPLARAARNPVPTQSSAPQAAALAHVKPATRQPAAAQRAQGAHTVQLGSFLSERDAQRALETYRARYTSLQGRDLQISEALVRGKRYFRVSAKGYSFAGSRALCSEVKQSGEGCLAHSPPRAMPGTIARGRRFVRI